MSATRLDPEILIRKVRARSLWRKGCAEARSRAGDAPRTAFPIVPVVPTRSRT